MKLLNVIKTDSFLIIVTDDGERKLMLSWRGIDAIEAKCRALIGKNIRHTTYGANDPNIWFDNVYPVEESSVSDSNFSGYYSAKNGYTDVANDDYASVKGRRDGSGVGGGNDSFFMKKGLPKAILNVVIPKPGELYLGKVEKIFGPPGTGKTTCLINEVREALLSGFHPSEIGYFSFTNKATEEAKLRMSKEFPQYSVEEDFPGFRTLHSLAYQSLNSRLKILTPKQALDFDPDFYVEEVFMREGKSDSLVYRAKQIVVDAASVARNRCISFYDYLVSSTPSDRYRLKKWLGYPSNKCEDLFTEADVEKLTNYIDEYEAYKKSLGVIDYTSILERCLDNPSGIEKYRLVIVDEAQDLSLLQWKLVKILLDECAVAYIAGDDDQAICESMGAEPQQFLMIDCDERTLNESYRVPKKIHQTLFKKAGLLEKMNVIFSNRKLKNWFSKGEKEGSVGSLKSSSDLVSLIKSSRGDWLIMSATNLAISNFSNILRIEGVPHFLSNQQIGGASEVIPNVRLMTVWGAKGGEAENAALLTEGFSNKKMLESDLRLVYVAMTRAKESFYIVH